MSTHRKFSASAAHRWLHCYGSHKLESMMPRRAPSKYADEGTRAHEIAAALLTGAPLIDADPEMIENVQKYVDFVRENSGGSLRVEFSADVIPGLLGGTTDAAFQRKDTLHICDLKYGRGVVVEAIENAQLMIYALACLPYYPTAKQVCVNILQPRIAGDTHKQWRLSVATLETFRSRVLDAVKRIQSGDETLNPGEHCRFCAARAQCSAELDAVSDLKLADNTYVLNNLKRIREICDAVEKDTYTRLCNGERIEGWKIVQKSARSKWAPDAFDKLHNTPGAIETRLIGITEARKLLGKQLVDALTVRESSGYTLAPESDKRPAAMVDAAELDNGDMNDE